MEQQTPRGPGAFKVLIALACTVVLVAGLRAAQAVFVPLLLAAFLALLGEVPFSWLKRWRVPSIVSASIVGLLTGGVLLLLGIGLATSLTEFRESLPRYQELLADLTERTIEQLGDFGISISPEDADLFDTQAWLGFAAQAAGQVVEGLSFTLLVLAFVFFVLLEFGEFGTKIRTLAGESGDLDRYEKVWQQLRKYVAVKTVMCVLTGIGAGCITLATDVPMWLLWAILAFLFNYVPVIGSIVAGIPPVILALLEYGYPTAAAVLAGYVIVNVGVSNFLEPILMGSRLQLSPLAVFLSLVFWGWLWGPVGMLLSVLLTRVAKIFLENTDELRWVAMLISRPERSAKNA